MSAPSLLLLAFALAGAKDAPLVIQKPLKLPAAMRPAELRPAEHPKDPKCEKCHAETGWESGAFPHDQTGFPLTGRHAQVSCQECHAKDLKAPLPHTCGGCHRDAHSTEFGARCEGCHTTSSWQTTFAVDAHRRSNFPLVGSHALVPCTECHLDARGRTFERPATPCVGCHMPDYQRAALRGVDHPALGFSTDCKSCHDPWRWGNATWRGHDTCFQISRGVHSFTACMNCHLSLNVAVTAVPGSCNSQTAACTRCHVHECAVTDPIHTKVPGYQCKDPKCYACHRFAAGP